ncbi:class I SAM-dependent methyltransferase [Pontivivens ytuae]|uniref:class I SAM-dependent methyltransferase n=1 Tax=Pontivivens ytuae TaxID=2789856 RepID=UPI001E2B9006|nr:class I SAM-dependent methyltransferase [Pontivivens ytuae]
MSWDQSADAWIASQGAHGDFARQYVLDTPMLARVRAFAPRRLLDLGCGEGRFCRRLAGDVEELTGLDPTTTLIARARALGGARFVEGRAERMPFADDSFDMVVSYLTLLDIGEIDAALDEVRRVLRPGGRVLIANLTGFATAANGTCGTWSSRPDGSRDMTVRRYLECRGEMVEWNGVSIENWHRPLSFYMQAFLSRGFTLTHFDEPACTDPAHPKAEAYDNAPYHLMMEWQAR